MYQRCILYFRVTLLLCVLCQLNFIHDVNEAHVKKRDAGSGTSSQSIGHSALSSASYHTTVAMKRGIVCTARRIFPPPFCTRIKSEHDITTSSVADILLHALRRQAE
jgi:hypothetical protein